MNSAVEWLRDPEHRVKAAWVLLIGSILGWIASHVLLVLTHPPGASSWVFHLLLALSWFAISSTAINIIITTDVRREQAEDGD